MSVNGFDFDGTVHRYNYNSLDNIPPNIAPAYSASSTYAVGDYCTKDNVLYKCSTAISTAEAWNSAHWTQVQLATDVADLKDDLSDVEDAIAAIVPGLSEEAKEALLACFEHVAWVDGYGQDYYDALAEALDVEPVPPVDPSRIFLYKFNDSLLSSGNADFGLTAPSPVYVSGKYDKCAQIGSSADNVPRNFNILSDNMPRFDKDFTLATWFKANVSTGATHTCFRFAKNISDSTLPIRTSELENLTYHNNYENWATGTTINQRYVGIALSYLWSASISRFYPSLSFFNKAHDAAYVFGLGNGTGDIPKQTWTHFAFCRKDNNCAIYIDGVKACSFTYSGELYVPSQIVFGCALTQTDPNGISLQSGAVPDIDEFYINDRECIYDGNFTPGEIVI